MGIDPAKLADDIYEASFVPELWPSILDKLTKLSNAVGGILFAQNQSDVKWLASEAAVPIMTDFVKEGWLQSTTRARRALALRHPGFGNDYELYTEEELAVDPAYVNFYRPRGLGWCVGTVIPVLSGDLIAFSIEQSYVRGPIGLDVVHRLNELRPHLARAALTSARLGLERARSAVSTLAALGLPAAVLTRTGRVVAANDLLEALHEQVRFLAHDRFSFVHKPAQALFAQGIEQCGLNPKAVLSIALPAAGEAPPAVAHLIPLQGQSHDIFARGDVVLLITALAAPSLPQADILAGLFDLTPAEARVARRIGGGDTAEAIASSLSLSPETIRTQVKAVLAKVGVKRQIELAGLLASVAKPAPHR